LTDGHLCLFAEYLRLFPGKIRSQIWLQDAQSAKMWRKTAQKAEISRMSIYLFFFEDTGMAI
jgi:hypothetical protein